jgi:hypothetical protein
MMAVVDDSSGRPYLSLAEAARLGPFSVAQVKHWMRSGVLVEGIHFTRPRGSRPLIVRDAFAAYLAGTDAALIAEHQRKQRRPSGRCNLMQAANPPCRSEPPH